MERFWKYTTYFFPYTALLTRVSRICGSFLSSWLTVIFPPTILRVAAFCSAAKPLLRFFRPQPYSPWFDSLLTPVRWFNRAVYVPLQNFAAVETEQGKSLIFERHPTNLSTYIERPTTFQWFVQVNVYMNPQKTTPTNSVIATSTSSRTPTDYDFGPNPFVHTKQRHIMNLDPKKWVSKLHLGWRTLSSNSLSSNICQSKDHLREFE